MAKPEPLEIEVHRLRPNPWNTNFVTPDNEAKLEASLKRFGLFKPIIVRDTEDGFYQILGGEHRWETAKKLGDKTVLCINLGVMDETRAKEISLVDNARYGTDDSLGLAKLLEDLDTDVLTAISPFTTSDIDALHSTLNIALDELDLDETIEEKAEVEADETKPAKAPKTHEVMRFKVTVADAQRVAKKIAQAQKRYGFTASDDLTNAGDALVALILEDDEDDEDEGLD